MAEKSVPVIGLRNRIPGPVRRLCVDKNDSDALITSVRLTPYVPIPFRVFAGASRLFKPGVLVRSMIQDHFDNDTHPPTVSRSQECLEILKRPVARMNRSIIRDVVTVVPQWRRVKREKPDSGNPKVLQIVESLWEAGEIADAVSIAGTERAHVKLINNGILIPEVIYLPCQRLTLPSILNNLRSVTHPQFTPANWLPLC